MGNLQSAMEYLMTYGWAILIIAVVLGALFQLGIFNASTFTPKAPPGSCHVFRPNGPMTTSFINTQGICNGELPQYVAKFNGNGYFDVGQEYNIITLAGTYSFSAWIYSSNDLSVPHIIFQQSPSQANNRNGLTDYVGTLSFGYENGVSWFEKSGPLSLNSWHHVVGIDAAGTLSLYIDAVPQTGSVAPYVDGSFTDLYIGRCSSIYCASFGGMMSNVQLYNSSLSSNEITALYNEGIGGAPVALKNLVGWWPLNGDTKDYSGNNNNGVPTALTFTSSWTSGYSAP